MGATRGLGGTAWIFGGTSTVGVAIARALARRGVRLVLVARRADDLTATAMDLHLRFGATVQGVVLDAEDPAYMARLEQALADDPGKVAGLVWAWGIMGREDDRSAQYIDRLLRVNTWACMATTEAFLSRLDPEGFVALIGSVAGDRGRAVNYLYGASKAALVTFAEGLRQRLAGTGPRVLLVKLGRVRSRMTEGMSGTADPDTVAERIVRALQGRAGRIYVPARWGLLMAVLRALPEPVWLRLRV